MHVLWLWCKGWFWYECQSHLFPGYASHYPLDGEAEVLEDLKPVQGLQQDFLSAPRLLPLCQGQDCLLSCWSRSPDDWVWQGSVALEHVPAPKEASAEARDACALRGATCDLRRRPWLCWEAGWEYIPSSIPVTPDLLQGCGADRLRTGVRVSGPPCSQSPGCLRWQSLLGICLPQAEHQPAVCSGWGQGHSPGANGCMLLCGRQWSLPPGAPWSVSVSFPRAWLGEVLCQAAVERAGPGCLLHSDWSLWVWWQPPMQGSIHSGCWQVSMCTRLQRGVKTWGLCPPNGSSRKQGGLSPLHRTLELVCPDCGSTCLLSRARSSHANWLFSNPSQGCRFQPDTFISILPSHMKIFLVALVV